MVPFAWSSQPDENKFNNTLYAYYAVYTFNVFNTYYATWAPSRLAFTQH